MTRKKIFVITTILVILLAGMTVFYWPEIRQYRQERSAKLAWQSDLKSKNPQLFKSIQDAIKNWLTMVKKSPTEFQPWLDLGANYQTLHEYGKAEDAYKKALAISPVSQVGWNNLAKLYEEQGKYDQAKQAYLKLIEYFPEEPTAYYDLASMYAAGHGGNIDDAKFILQQGLIKTGIEDFKPEIDRINKEGKL